MLSRHALRRPSAGQLSRLFQEQGRLQGTANVAIRSRQRLPYPVAALSDQTPKAATKEDIVFITPRVKDLYERMIQLDEDEVGTVGLLVLEILEKPIEENEFYYHGIGGAGGGGKAGASAEAEATEEPEKKSVVDLKLTGFDAKSKIKVIKEVRALANLGLKEAKELVEGAPKILQKDLKPEAAEELKEKLEAVGATVEIV